MRFKFTTNFHLLNQHQIDSHLKGIWPSGHPYTCHSSPCRALLWSSVWYKFIVLLLQPLEWWDHSSVPSCPTEFFCFTSKSHCVLRRASLTFDMGETHVKYMPGKYEVAPARPLCFSLVPALDTTHALSFLSILAFIVFLISGPLYCSLVFLYFSYYERMGFLIYQK